MTHRRCDDRNCPDCYPERWEHEDDEPQGLPWQAAYALLALMVALAVLYVSGHATP